MGHLETGGKGKSGGVAPVKVSYFWANRDNANCNRDKKERLGWGTQVTLQGGKRGSGK